MLEMTKELIDEMNSIKFWHRTKLGNYITNGLVVHGPDDGSYMYTRFGLPKDLTGKTVLDIGTWDGMFAFETEKCGAKSVKGIDIYQYEQYDLGQFTGNKGFEFCKKVLESKVEFERKSFMDVTEQYDVILFYGVLYHLTDPLLGIKKLAEITKETCIIETAIVNPAQCTNIAKEPVLYYSPGFDSDPTNAFYPNSAFMEKAFKWYGFKTVEEIYNDSYRATYVCKK